ncbi:amino acid ABC transporter permease [Vibrio agarilyticus]|nr:amino acid ABC transporter permease [Vibrio agarilyticus]
MLLMLIMIACAWLYQRAHIGVEYNWRWQDALSLLFTPPSHGGVPYFVQGFIATMRLCLWGLLLAIIVGSLMGLARCARSPWLTHPARMFVLVMRNIPPLVFVFIFYFFISNQLIPLLGLESLLRDTNEPISFWQEWLFGPSRLWENLLSGVLCIGLLSAAYIAEVVRAGISGIDKGQWEAGHALGLSTWAQYRFVIGPQVLKAIAPAFAGQTIALVKDSSIVSLISIQELTFVGSEIANSSGLIFEIWLIIGGGYLLLCSLLSLLFSRIKHIQ